jgi:L-ribulokinase
VAAGTFRDLATGVEAMRPPVAQTYRPDAAAGAVYDRVYAVYRELYEHLGRGRTELLHGLKQIRNEERRST